MLYPKRVRTLLGALLLTFATGLVSAGEGRSESDYYNEELEARLEEARKQLDEAARRLAELHERTFETGRQAYSQADAFFTKRAMLGVLLGGGDSADGVALVGVPPGRINCFSGRTWSDSWSLRRSNRSISVAPTSLRPPRGADPADHEERRGRDPGIRVAEAPAP